MQTQTKSSLGSSLLNRFFLLCAAFVLAGCASTGYHKSDTAALSMQQTAAAVQNQSRCLNSTLTSLKTLTSSTQGDLKPKFKSFSTSLDATIASCKRAEAAARDMQRKSAAYFAAWSNELSSINYAVIRDSSSARKDEVRARFVELNRRFQDTQAVVKPLVAYLQDIRTALSTDLTAGGIQSVSSIVAKADDSASKVQAGLAQMTAELTSSSAQMSSLASQQTEQAAAVTQQTAPATNTPQPTEQQPPASTQQPAAASEQTAATQQAPATAATPGPDPQAQPH
jgi:hypothetical protein